MTRRRLAVFADYGTADPLWPAESGFKPSWRKELTLGGDLEAELAQWGRDYDDALSSNRYEWPSEEYRQAWNARGRELARRGAAELESEYEIEYLDVETGKREVVRPSSE